MRIKIAGMTFYTMAALIIVRPSLHAQQPARPLQPRPSLLSTQGMRSVWDGVYTSEQAKRGERIYRQECATCHGPTLAGGESAPPLTGGEFTSNWDGLTVGDLFERIRLTMPQDHPERLSGQQHADVLSFMLSANRFPAGKTELARQAEFLKQIKFETSKH